MRIRTLFFLLTTTLYFAANAGAIDVPNNIVPKIADVVWTEFSNDGHTLRMARFDGEAWSEPSIIYRSENSLTSPAMATDSDGKKIVVWSERRKAKVVLKFKTRARDQSDWSEEELLSDLGIENLATSIVIDRDNRTWVFWASDGNSLSDIVEIHSNDTSWSEPRVIHPENNVPDIHPIAKLNNKGQIVVDWATYSFDQQSYVTESLVLSVFESDSQQVNQQSAELLVDVVKLSDIPLPDFLPDNAISHIHFPGNKMIQSEPLVPSVMP